MEIGPWSYTTAGASCPERTGVGSSCMLKEESGYARASKKARDALDGGCRKNSPPVNISVYKCIIISNFRDFKAESLFLEISTL